MVKNKLYGFLFFMVTMMANHMVAMDIKHQAFFIENPFDKKQEDDVQLTLDSSMVLDKDVFFTDSGEGRGGAPVKEQNDLALVSHSRVIHSPKKQLFKLRKKKKRRYVDVFDQNEDEKFECPYNCQDEYAHKKKYNVVSHIKRRHDQSFDLQTFDRQTANLDAWIPPQRKAVKKKYRDVFKKNERDEYVCPYNCPDKYASNEGECVLNHIRRRHDSTFDLQTSDLKKANLDRYIPRKREKKYVEVFEKNESGEFICPYNCPDEYTHKVGNNVGKHIKARHDKKFNLHTFDRNIVDLDTWIPRNALGGVFSRKYADVFAQNNNVQYECPYNCPDEYTHKNGQLVVSHIKRRHDKAFDLQTFDEDEADLNAWIPPRKKGGRKRKRKKHDTKSRLKKKRKLAI